MLVIALIKSLMEKQYKTNLLWYYFSKIRLFKYGAPIYGQKRKAEPWTTQNSISTTNDTLPSWQWHLHI